MKGVSVIRNEMKGDLGKTNYSVIRVQQNTVCTGEVGPTSDYIIVLLVVVVSLK